MEITFLLRSLLITLTIVSLYSCTKTYDETNHMAFENVSYVTEFPKTFTLSEGYTPDINQVGIAGIKIFEDYLIVQRKGGKGLWNFYSLPDLKDLGSFLKRGEGPLEFMQGQSVTNKSSVTREGESILAYLYDFQKGRVMKFDISKSLTSGELSLEELSNDVPPFLFEFVALDDETFFLKNLENRDTQHIRTIQKNGKSDTLEVFKSLNKAQIRQGEDINLLASLIKYNEYQKKFVEVPIGLNNINIYNLDGSFAKSICVGEKLSDLNLIQDQYKFNRIYTFAQVTIFEEFFGVIHVDKDEKSYQQFLGKYPSLLLFDWEGNPLGKIEMKGNLTSFDIDFKRQKLYTFDIKSDEFFVYDIAHILSEL